MNEQPPIILPNVGVDVGFFQVKYTWGRERSGRISAAAFPSDVVSGHVVGVTKKPVYTVPVSSGAVYLVGPGIRQYLPGHGARAVRPNYSTHPEYEALFIGALVDIARRHKARRIKIQQVTSGLRVDDYFKDKEALKAMAGTSRLIPGQAWDGGDLEVQVLNVNVVPQPLGSLFCAYEGPCPQVESTLALVLDVGGGTLDGYVADELDPLFFRCASAPVGTLKVAAELCTAMNVKADQPALISRIDSALREQKASVNILGEDVALAPHRPRIEAILSAGLKDVLKKVGDLQDMQIILLSGGGAHLLEPVLRKELASDERLLKLLHHLEEPWFSNVRGFYAYGEIQNART